MPNKTAHGVLPFVMHFAVAWTCGFDEAEGHAHDARSCADRHAFGTRPGLLGTRKPELWRLLLLPSSARLGPSSMGSGVAPDLDPSKYVPRGYKYGKWIAIKQPPCQRGYKYGKWIAIKQPPCHILTPLPKLYPLNCN